MWHPQAAIHYRCAISFVGCKLFNSDAFIAYCKLWINECYDVLLFVWLMGFIYSYEEDSYLFVGIRSYVMNFCGHLDECPCRHFSMNVFCIDVIVACVTLALSLLVAPWSRPPVDFCDIDGTILSRSL